MQTLLWSKVICIQLQKKTLYGPDACIKKMLEFQKHRLWLPYPLLPFLQFKQTYCSEHKNF